MSISEAIHNRKSCRAYLDQDVDKEAVKKILEAAKWAPSGVNHQPAQVAILGKETRRQLSKALVDKYISGVKPNPDYIYCPKEWADVYKNRRKECGLALYNSLSISVDDLENRRKHWVNNYHFFQAPIGIIVFIEKGLPIGSWLDVGMFIQNILLVAQEHGLATCAQAAFAEYPDAVREVLSLTNVDIICGIAMGYENTDHSLNSYRTTREPLESFAKWYL